MGRQQGLDEEKLRQLPEYEVSQVFERDEIAALRYADALTATPAEVPDEVYAELTEVFDEVQIVELTSALAWENYRARFDHALKMEAEGFSEGAFCPLPSAAASEGK